MDLVIDLLSWVFLVAGAFFMFVAGLGVLRLPDVFSRMHAAGMKDTLGLALTMVGLILQAGFTLVSAKLVLIWAFLWFASPVAGHATARAALLGGVKPVLYRRGGGVDTSGTAASVREEINRGEGERA